MTPTPEGKQLAADLANAFCRGVGSSITWNADEFGDKAAGSLAPTLARLATEHLALKAEHEKALADLREIDQINAGGLDNCQERTIYIAAKWRVETDPLVDAVDAIEGQWMRGEITTREALEATAKRGYEIGEKS